MSSSLAGTPGAPTALRRRTLRILYADDVRELREVARLSLRREGHDIECVEDGGSALARVRADPQFDLLITDHHMPGMNGLELVTCLRELSFPGRILVFCSELDPQVAADYRAQRVDCILYKPVYPSELRRKLAVLFGLPE